jgi:UDP-N-acetylglucosamine 2-epimerase (non-hydrolysing)
MKKVFNIVGARPNFMKIAPIHKRMQATAGLVPVLVHTGQHYDGAMSKVFFEELGLPEPDIYLGVGSGSHGEQTGRLLVELEKVMVADRPDLVVVVGDVNSTMAAAIDAAKLGIPVAHVEAGLRSFDRGMPEEINRIVTDALSDLLFVSEDSGRDNLLREGARADRIHFVGNVMIDSLLGHRARAETSTALARLGLDRKRYALVTLHRPSNVDSSDGLRSILGALARIQREISIVFPIHPRTRKMIEQYGLSEIVESMPDLYLIDPQGYLDFLRLMMDAGVVLTDSGGIQEETTVLGVPCVTLRDNTERPVTVTLGTNTLVGMDPERIVSAAFEALNGHCKTGKVPPLWDGRASERIVELITNQV